MPLTITQTIFARALQARRPLQHELAQHSVLKISLEGCIEHSWQEEGHCKTRMPLTITQAILAWALQARRRLQQ